MSTPFAFVIHPLEARDARRRYPMARYVPDSVLEWVLRRKRPIVASEVSGIRSLTGERTHGWFIGCPLTARQMSGGIPIEEVYGRLAECCEIAAAQGAEIIGLGAFTAVAGDAGITVAKRSPIAVTTGNSYTVATAIEGAIKACGLVGILPAESVIAVVGATGSIGKTCARMLGREFGRSVLIGRDLERTSMVAETIERSEATTDLERLREADLVVTVTSSDTSIIEPHHLKAGSVVCDVARPRDVSVRVARDRPDVLVIEGGVVEVPGQPDFGIEFGFPSRTAYACMSETMMLALEKRFENYTIGKDVSEAQVEETLGWAKKHGFKLAGFRSFERAVEDAAILRAREARLGTGSVAGSAAGPESRPIPAT